MEDGTLPPAFVKEWVPNFLQETIERKGGNHGMTLNDMALMAATLEDLVHREVQTRLKVVYDAHLAPTQSSVTRDRARDILSTYLMTFLLANNLTAKSRDQLMVKKQLFAKKYKGYADVAAWHDKLVQEHLGGSTELVDFAGVSAVVEDVGAKFHTFNDIECNDLRSTLRSVESPKKGRVRLSTFYNMSRFTHWRFTEKAEYLKTLGALDDTDPSKPSVIIANYVMARPNCLEGSNLFAICCRNLCEDLMSKLEREVGAANAPAHKVSALVANMASDSVHAPRELSPALLGRLDEVAKHHGGEVPLHGRLFAQWMHHAFPRECPFPHESGSINPQTPDEWMKESGMTTQSSEEEMQKHVDGDVCAINWEGNPACGDEVTDLPWNPVEELLAIPSRAQAPDVSMTVPIMLLGLGIAGLLITAMLLSKQNGGSLEVQQKKMLSLMAMVVVACLVWSLDLMDGSVVILSLGGSGVLFLAFHASRHGGKSCKGMLPEYSKGV